MRYIIAFFNDVNDLISVHSDKMDFKGLKNLSTNQYNQSINQSNNRSINQTIDQSSNQQVSKILVVDLISFNKMANYRFLPNLKFNNRDSTGSL